MQEKHQEKPFPPPNKHKNPHLEPVLGGSYNAVKRRRETLLLPAPAVHIGTKGICLWHFSHKQGVTNPNAHYENDSSLYLQVNMTSTQADNYQPSQ